MEVMKRPLLVFGLMAFLTNAEPLSEPPQCTSHTNLMRTISGKRYNDTYCDNVLAETEWYKFSSSYGTIIPTSPVVDAECRTERMGWLKGSLPCKRYETLQAVVCFGQNCRDGREEIKITLCNDTYVFQLPKLPCTNFTRRYCGKKSEIPVKSCKSKNSRLTATPTISTKAIKQTPSLKDISATFVGIATIIAAKSTTKASQTILYASKTSTLTEIVTMSVSTTANPTKSPGEQEVKDLQEKVKKLNNATDKERRLAASEILVNLSKTTDLDVMDKKQQENGLSNTTIKTTIDIIKKIVSFNISNTTGPEVLKPVNNILDKRNKNTWKSFGDDEEVRTLVTTLEKYGFQYGADLKNNSNISTFLNLSNIQLHVQNVKDANSFLDEKRQFSFPNASFDLSQGALPSDSSATIVVIWYKTLNSFLPNSSYPDEQGEVKSEIITASVRPEPSEMFSPPVRFTWNTTSLNDSLACVFWKPEKTGSNWKTTGCKRIKDGNRLICECNHLTAFACMDISRNLISEREREVLELISTIGCSISLFGIILTIIAHVILWRRLQQNSKSKVPSQVLIHLCVAIGMTDILAVMAGPAQNNEKFCTAVSILLYFFVLAVFGWMLCEGVVIYLQLVNVYTGLSLGGRHLKIFYVVGWGVPAAVVALLVGLSGRDNFITKNACWCSSGGAVFYTFVCAVGIILLTNIVIFTLALRNALSFSDVNTARSLSAKKGKTGSPKTTVGSTFRKAKVALKGSAVLLPLLGLTWIFGLLVFNRDTIVFKYLFAIFNSLQGLMIFVFHVLINKRIHDAISREKKARKAQNVPNLMVNSNTCSTLQTSDGSPGKSSLPVTPVSERKNYPLKPGTKNKYTIMTENDSLRPDKSNSKAAREVVSEDLELITYSRI